jgi:hypothetical protein
MNGEDLVRIANILKMADIIDFSGLGHDNGIFKIANGYSIDYCDINAHFPFNPIKEYIMLYYGKLRKVRQPKLPPHLINEWVKVWFRNKRTIFEIDNLYYSVESTPETNKAFVDGF